MRNNRNGRWAMLLIALAATGASAQPAKPIDADKARVADYWTVERKARAIPRDLAIDQRGLGYLRGPGGVLEPYGHKIAAEAAQPESTPSPFGKPSRGGTSGGSTSGDSTPPTVNDMDPGAGAVIGASHVFSAQVTDSSGVASVSFRVRKGSAPAQSFSAAKTSGTDTWTVALTGFTDGDWSWEVVAKDATRKGGNTVTTPSVAFTVSTGAGEVGGAGTVTNAHWTFGGAVQTAAGRIYFEMPGNSNRSVWNGYVCSGTVATDGTIGRSVIITAAHCVYDDANKSFARNVMFIPDQDQSSARTDRNCSNDPLGCWIPSWGVVDVNWTTRTFPNNIAWDYAFYVVADSGAHQGTAAASSALDSAAGSMAVSFAAVKNSDPSSHDDFTHALGYSYSDDPNFMYCAEDVTTNGAVNWWLPSCGLSGGSSGGPWVQPMNTATGSGPIVSVNSWGYTNKPGMAGPKLVGTSAQCVFVAAKSVTLPGTPPLDGNAGTAVTCP